MKPSSLTYHCYFHTNLGLNDLIKSWWYSGINNCCTYSAKCKCWHSLYSPIALLFCPKYKVQVWMGSNTIFQMLQLSVTHHDFGLILQKEHFISRPICQHTNGICIQSLWLNSLCLDQGFWNQPSEVSRTPKIIKWAWWLKLVAQQVLILLGLQGLCDVQF